ncbi:hypothetical protein EA71_01831 [Enterococcus durans]|uniref:Uncharacterized protein n=1 Tax=Enterococcus durans TaxID=53345 RepID=A0A367CF26_9ENTE|nr:hypothetical protein EA71_01831 [Enterococcus durans]
MITIMDYPEYKKKYPKKIYVRVVCVSGSVSFRKYEGRVSRCEATVEWI